jgi:hypothetical protein
MAYHKERSGLRPVSVHIDERMTPCQLPRDEKHERHRRYAGEKDDEVRLKPVAALSFVEHDLQCAKT